jgi:SOS-response transcriptional repressor LexA
MHDLTERQKIILLSIIKFIKDNDYSPTFREIGLVNNITIKGVVDHCECLRKKGFITWHRHLARTIKPTGKEIL